MNGWRWGRLCLMKDNLAVSAAHDRDPWASTISRRFTRSLMSGDDLKQKNQDLISPGLSSV